MLYICKFKFRSSYLEINEKINKICRMDASRYTAEPTHFDSWLENMGNFVIFNLPCFILTQTFLTQIMMYRMEMWFVEQFRFLCVWFFPPEAGYKHRCHSVGTLTISWTQRVLTSLKQLFMVRQCLQIASIRTKCLVYKTGKRHLHTKM